MPGRSRFRLRLANSALNRICSALRDWQFREPLESLRPRASAGDGFPQVLMSAAALFRSLLVPDPASLREIGFQTCWPRE